MTSSLLRIKINFLVEVAYTECILLIIVIYADTSWVSKSSSVLTIHEVQGHYCNFFFYFYYMATLNTILFSYFDGPQRTVEGISWPSCTHLELWRNSLKTTSTRERRDSSKMVLRRNWTDSCKRMKLSYYFILHHSQVLTQNGLKS